MTAGTIVPARSRGTSIRTSPISVGSVLPVVPFREFPLPCPDRWPGGARRRGGASLVCGVCMERRRASLGHGCPG